MFYLYSRGWGRGGNPKVKSRIKLLFILRTTSLQSNQRKPKSSVLHHRISVTSELTPFQLYFIVDHVPLNSYLLVSQTNNHLYFWLITKENYNCLVLVDYDSQSVIQYSCAWPFGHKNNFVPSGDSWKRRWRAQSD